MEGVFTKSAYCKRALFGLIGSLVRRLQGERKEAGKWNIKTI